MGRWTWTYRKDGGNRVVDYAVGLSRSKRAGLKAAVRSVEEHGSDGAVDLSPEIWWVSFLDAKGKNAHRLVFGVANARRKVLVPLLIQPLHPTDDIAEIRKLAEKHLAEFHKTGAC